MPCSSSLPPSACSESFFARSHSKHQTSQCVYSISTYGRHNIVYDCAQTNKRSNRLRLKKNPFIDVMWFGGDGKHHSITDLQINDTEVSNISSRYSVWQSGECVCVCLCFFSLSMTKWKKRWKEARINSRGDRHTTEKERGQREKENKCEKARDNTFFEYVVWDNMPCWTCTLNYWLRYSSQTIKSDWICCCCCW